KSKGEGALPECAWDVRDSSGNEVKSEQLQTKRVNIDELPDLSDFTLLTGYGCVIETKHADGLTYSSFDRPIIVTLPGEMIDSSFDNERNAAFMFYWDELRGQWLALPTRLHANGDVSAFLERPALVAFL